MPFVDVGDHFNNLLFNNQLCIVLRHIDLDVVIIGDVHSRSERNRDSHHILQVLGDPLRHHKVTLHLKTGMDVKDSPACSLGSNSTTPLTLLGWRVCVIIVRKKSVILVLVLALYKLACYKN